MQKHKNTTQRLYRTRFTSTTHFLHNHVLSQWSHVFNNSSPLALNKLSLMLFFTRTRFQLFPCHVDRANNFTLRLFMQVEFADQNGFRVPKKNQRWKMAAGEVIDGTHSSCVLMWGTPGLFQRRNLEEWRLSLQWWLYGKILWERWNPFKCNIYWSQTGGYTICTFNSLGCPTLTGHLTSKSQL